MANLEELVIQLTAETSGLKAELESASRTTREQASKMQASLDELAKNSQKNMGFFQSSMASAVGFLASQAVIGAVSVVKDAFAAMTDEMMKGGEAAIKQEVALQRLANSLAATGQYTVEAQRSLEEFSNAMEDETGIADDVIQSNLALLSSMTKLSADGLMKAEKAAADLSVAYGIDLESATRLVGKGIEGNTEAFKRYGIEIQAGADKTENLSRIMAAIPFGAAKGQLNTFAGSLTFAKNGMDNLFESLASTVTKNPVVVAMFKELGNIFRQLTSDTDKNAIALREGFANAILFSAKAIGVTLIVIDNLIRGLRIMYNTIDMTRAAVTGFGGAIIDAFQGKGFDPLKGVKTNIEDIKDAASNQTMFGDLAEKIAQVETAGSNAFDSIKNSADAASPSIKGTTNTIKELTEAQKAHNEIVKSFAQGLADQSREIGNAYGFQNAVLKNAMETEAITKEEYFAASLEAQQAQFELENAALQEAFANKMITEQAFRDAQTALAQKQATEEMALMLQKTNYEKEQQKQRAQNLKDSFSYIASLSSSGNQTLAAIGKAAAITTATIDGYAAVQKALASAPPPFNFALAALVGTATAANVAKIAGVGLKGGIDSVPGVGNQDNFPAVLAPGERVVPAKSNEDLNNFLADQREGGGSRTININVNIAAGTGITREQAASIVEGLNDYITSGGLKVLNA